MFYLFLVVSFLFLFVTPICVFFFFNDTATTEIYTLSLHDALPIYGGVELSRTEVVHAVVGRMTLHGSMTQAQERSEEHTSELQSRLHLVCRLLLEKKKKKNITAHIAVARAPTNNTHTLPVARTT